MRRRLVRWLFIATVPLLFLQLLFVKAFEEPYPSVRFPGFGHVFSANYPHNYVNMSVIVQAADQQQTYTMNELLPLTPQYAKVFFKPMSEKFKNLPDTLTNNPASSSEYDELMDYLKRSALDQTAFNDIDKITLQWYRYEVPQPNASPTVVPVEFKTILYH